MVHAGGRHHWSLINDNFDIVVETTQDLGSPFAWAPPLSTESRDADDLLAGLDSISPDDIAVKFAGHEDEKDESFDGVEVLEENVFLFYFGELNRVERGMIPQAILDGVEECYTHCDSLVLPPRKTASFAGSSAPYTSSMGVLWRIDFIFIANITR
ncbi:hypothetical protein BDR06DRAFT_537555 [Suillus hirtellus]|nr:hypothetical protein BDR06DRAFT_537555 [Suillus hirtellus]